MTKSDITVFFNSSYSSAAVIAIPARNEGDRIGKCLAALAIQRDRFGTPVPRILTEIYARCDPRPHDPWPNHRVSSGASFAVKLSAYRAVGGLPPKAVGEDIAFTDLLDRAGFRVRHSLDVSVTTSCRLDGRASVGAADTMRHRRDVPNAQCDAELEPALPTLRRAVLRGLLRKAWHERTFDVALRRRRQSSEVARLIAKNCSFNDALQELCMQHPATRLRPSDLPRQIAIAGFILRPSRHF